MTPRLLTLPSPLIDALDAELGELLRGDGAGVPREVWERALFAPARDFLARRGKQLRGRLVEAGWRLGGGDGPCPARLPLMLEVLHAGSLIVDDIEDGSSHRRGLPALHERFGLAVALNTGNWMTWWPSLLIERLELPPAAELELRRVLGRAVIACHHGQGIDLSARVFELRRRDLPGVVAAASALKTGALTELAAVAGAVAAGAPAARVAELARFGREAGVALQMLDDVGNLDGERDPDKRHEDVRLGRPTWPWAWVARDLADAPFADLQGMARAVTHAVEEPGPLAALLLRLTGARGRLRAVRRLRRAHDVLTTAIGERDDDLALAVDLLEKSYV